MHSTPLPLNMFLECVLSPDQHDAVGNEYDAQQRQVAINVTQALHGNNVAVAGDGGGDAQPLQVFLRGANGRRITRYRLWVFLEALPTLESLMVDLLRDNNRENAISNRSEWLHACAIYLRDDRFETNPQFTALCMSNEVPLDSIDNPASPVFILDARAQLGDQVGLYNFNVVWRFPMPSCVLRLPVARLLFPSLHDSFALLPTPHSQAPLLLPVAHCTATQIDTLLQKLRSGTHLSENGRRICDWLFGDERRFSPPPPTLDVRLSPLASRIARTFLQYDQLLGTYSTHLAIFISLCAAHSAYRRSTDGLRLNVLVYGDMAQSKSYLLDQVARQLIARTAAMVTRETARGTDTMDEIDVVKILDECQTSLFAKTKGTSSTSAIVDAQRVLKETTTTGRVTLTSRGITSVAVKQLSIIGATNLKRADIDNTVASRFILINSADLCENRLVRQDATSLSVQLERGTAPALAIHRAALFQDAHCTQAMLFAIEKAIELDIVVDVSFIVLPRVQRRYTDILQTRFGVAVNPRHLEQVKSMVRVLTLRCAIERLYNDPASPVYNRPLSLYHLALLNPLLVDNEEVCHLALDLLCHNWIDDASDSVAHALRSSALLLQKWMSSHHGYMFYDSRERDSYRDAHAERFKADFTVRTPDYDVVSQGGISIISLLEKSKSLAPPHVSRDAIGDALQRLLHARVDSAAVAHFEPIPIGSERGAWPPVQRTNVRRQRPLPIGALMVEKVGALHIHSSLIFGNDDREFDANGQFLGIHESVMRSALLSHRHSEPNRTLLSGRLSASNTPHLLATRTTSVDPNVVLSLTDPNAVQHQSLGVIQNVLGLPPTAPTDEPAPNQTLNQFAIQQRLRRLRMLASPAHVAHLEWRTPIVGAGALRYPDSFLRTLNHEKRTYTIPLSRQYANIERPFQLLERDARKRGG